MAIRKYRINVSAFIRSYLPPHWRKPNRIKLWEVLLTPFTILNSDFVVWRNKAITQANVSNEKTVLEWYLNSLFDPTLERIYLQRRQTMGAVFGVEDTEPTLFHVAGVEVTEPTDFVAVGITGEDPVLGTYNFGAFVPSALMAQEAAIMAVLIQYSKANKKYKIFYF